MIRISTRHNPIISLGRALDRREEGRRKGLERGRAEYKKNGDITAGSSVDKLRYFLYVITQKKAEADRQEK